MRLYSGGGTRSNNGGKLEYLGFRHPLVEHSFAKYMNRHRIQEDGKLRTSNNWWKGLDANDTIQSLLRHVTDLEALHANLFVYKVMVGKDEDTVIMPHKVDKKGWVEVNKEEAINAVKFNCNSYLLEHLKTN